MSFELHTTTLSEICTEVSYGYTASADTDVVGPKFLRITDIQGGTVNWEDVPYCEIPESKLSKNLLAKGDIVVARTGNSTGENYLFSGEQPSVFASYLIKFKVDKNIANPHYVWLQMRTKRWWDFVSGSKSGSAQAGANAKVLGKFEVSLPPRSIQEQVVQIVSGLSSKIAVNSHINQTLEEMAQAIFKSWFVDFDPVKAKMNGQQPEDMDEVTASLFPEKLVESELGLIPEGWEIKSLDKIAHFQNGLALQKFRPESDEDDFLPVLKIAQLRQGYCDEKEKARADIKESCRVYDGDMIFSWSGSLMIDLWTGGNAALNQHLFKVTSKDYSLSLYLHWTKHHLAKFQQIAKDKAVTMGHIKRGHLSEAMCLIPHKELQKKLDEILMPLIKQGLNLRLQSNKLSNLRDTLLPKLLSGEIELAQAHKLAKVE